MRDRADRAARSPRACDDRSSNPRAHSRHGTHELQRPHHVARIARALTYLVYTFALVTLVLLVLGFVLELFGANPDAPFAEWLYRGLRRVMAPFRGLFEPVPLDGRSVLDPSILFAMLVYGIVALALSGLIGWLTDRILELRAGLTRHGREALQPLG